MPSGPEDFDKIFEEIKGMFDKIFNEHNHEESIESVESQESNEYTTSAAEVVTEAQE